MEARPSRIGSHHPPHPSLIGLVGRSRPSSGGVRPASDGCDPSATPVIVGSVRRSSPLARAPIGPPRDPRPPGHASPPGGVARPRASGRPSDPSRLACRRQHRRHRGRAGPERVSRGSSRASEGRLSSAIDREADGCQSTSATARFGGPWPPNPRSAPTNCGSFSAYPAGRRPSGPVAASCRVAAATDRWASTNDTDLRTAPVTGDHIRAPRSRPRCDGALPIPLAERTLATVAR
jgi:hypothetical protein